MHHPAAAARGSRCRFRTPGRVASWLTLLLLVGFWSSAHPSAQPHPFAWHLPAGFPQPRVPVDNPITAAKVELGRHLFYDTRLSSDRTFSCATCHQQARAFADDKGRGVGVTGAVHPRGPMSLGNVAYAPALTWANPTVRRLESQALVPMFGIDPVELGLAGRETVVLGRLRTEPRYRRLFPAAFPDVADPFSIEAVTQALASFERTLLSGRSPYDRYRTTLDASAIPPAAHRGEDLFFSGRLSCFRCHAGFNFTSVVDHVESRVPSFEFHNNGLYNVDGRGGYPAPNTGIHAVSRVPEDMGRFKPPTLRNIALTAPYMHDGSLKTLDDVIAHYERGGPGSPLRSRFITGFTLTAGERADLIAFLVSLTDTTFTSDPAFADPWAAPPSAPASSAGPTSSPSVRPAAPRSLQASATVSPRAVDFDAALRALGLDPATTDVASAPDGTGNGIPDADEMALVAAILANPAIDLRASGGVDHRAVMGAFRAARSQAIDDIRILSAVHPTAADVVAGYALIGRRAFAAYVRNAREFGSRLTGDYEAAFALEPRLAADGDADGDGATNLEEYTSTRRGGRAAFVGAALNPAVK